MPCQRHGVRHAVQGCAGAVRRVLGKLDGVDKVDISVPEKKVVVTGSANPEVIKDTVSKTGKKTEFWS